MPLGTRQRTESAKGKRTANPPATNAIVVINSRLLVATGLALQACPGHVQDVRSESEILLDIVRCPPAQVNQHVGKLMRWFYDHLARLVYAEATNWKAATIDPL